MRLSLIGSTMFVNVSIQALTGAALLLGSSLTFLLPSTFQEHIFGAVRRTYAGAERPNLMTQLEASSKAPFVAFDEEVINLLAPNTSLELVTVATYPFADEMGVWIWSSNEVWLTGPTINGSNYLTALDLDTRKV